MKKQQTANVKPTAGVDGKTRLMSKHEVMDHVGLSYPTIWQMMLDGKFPRSRELGRGVRWIAGEIEDWCRNRPVKKLKNSDGLPKAWPTTPSEGEG
jgi:predicted DNA-binding transcriptional regulator AlpA